MSSATWHTVGGVDPAALKAARNQLINAVQWTARLAHSFLAHEPDDAHLLLAAEPGEGKLVSRAFLPGLSLELAVAELALQFRENGLPSPHILLLEGRTPSQAEAWILVELLHRHADRDRFSKALPYELARPMTGDAAEYEPEKHAEGLAELARWLANATTALADAGREQGVAPVVHPRFLDLHVVLPVDGPATAPSRAVRLGFVPGDERTNEPFFYAVPRPALIPASDPSIARIGRSEPRDVAETVMTAAEAAKGGAAAVTAFLKKARDEARRKLAH